VAKAADLGRCVRASPREGAGGRCRCRQLSGFARREWAAGATASVRRPADRKRWRTNRAGSLGSASGMRSWTGARAATAHLIGGPMEREEMKRLYLEHREVQEARDLDAVVATFDDDCFLENVALGTRAFGREAVRKSYEVVTVGFAD
jgi:hypothetical protein